MNKGASLSSRSLPNIDGSLALDVETRLELVQKLWDSIFQDAQQGLQCP